MSIFYDRDENNTFLTFFLITNFLATSPSEIAYF